MIRLILNAVCLFCDAQERRASQLALYEKGRKSVKLALAASKWRKRKARFSTAL